MRNVVLQMGISIDGYVSGGPEDDIGAGEAEHTDVVARKMAWVRQAGLHGMGRVPYEEMSGAGRRLELAEVTPYPDGTVISIYRRPR
jgi:hypothetical protein